MTQKVWLFIGIGVIVALNMFFIKVVRLMWKFVNESRKTLELYRAFKAVMEYSPFDIEEEYLSKGRSVMISCDGCVLSFDDVNCAYDCFKNRINEVIGYYDEFTKLTGLISGPFEELKHELDEILAEIRIAKWKRK